MIAYRRLSQRDDASQVNLYWACVSLLIASFVLGLVGLWWIPAIPYVAVSSVLLSRVLADRASVVSRVGGVDSLASHSFHVGLWIASTVLEFTLCGLVIGVPLGVIQGVRFLQDHNKLVAAGKEKLSQLR
jgi:hypothetical protein